MALMGIPVTVVLDRSDLPPLDLTPMIEPGSLNWSSVVPGGFASCSFQINGDFRRLLKLLPYLSIVRVVGDSGRVLFEGQIEDLSPVLSESSVGITVGAFGLQNVLKEYTLRQIWSKRDMQWLTPCLSPVGTAFVGSVTPTDNMTVTTGQFDPTDPTKSGVQVTMNGTILINNGEGQFADWVFPIGMTVLKVLGTVAASGTNAGTGFWECGFFDIEGGVWTSLFTVAPTTPSGFNVTLGSNATALRVGVFNNNGSGGTLNANDVGQFYDMRVLGVLTSEDTADGFYGDTLIRSVIGLLGGELGTGVIESGSDYLIDHLDVSVRRTAYDILTEITSYYSREWAVWEAALLDWRTPNLQQHQWILPIKDLASLNLDASVQNSNSRVLVVYTDAASQQGAEAQGLSTDRRNPYVLRGRIKDEIVQGGTMTANTSAQLATQVLNDLGFGPVPAAGTVVVAGETIVSHASGAARKAWEIRAGDNVTIPELPLADVFTQDGRGECLFHVVSAEADSQNVTLTLDSYGSKRSDVLLARLAAVTSLLGG